MAPEDFLNGFCILGRDQFPAHLCTVPYEREPEVMNSSDDSYHLVITVDSRFKGDGRLQVMKPYVAKDEDGTYYGWVDRSDNPVSHGDHPVDPGDHEKVVAWKTCSKDFDLRDVFRVGRV